MATRVTEQIQEIDTAEQIAEAAEQVQTFKAEIVIDSETIAVNIANRLIDHLIASVNALPPKCGLLVEFNEHTHFVTCMPDLTKLSDPDCEDVEGALNEIETEDPDRDNILYFTADYLSQPFLSEEEVALISDILPDGSYLTAKERLLLRSLQETVINCLIEMLTQKVGESYTFEIITITGLIAMRTQGIRINPKVE